MLDELLMNLKGKMPYVFAGIAVGYLLKDVIDIVERNSIVWDIEHDYDSAYDEIEEIIGLN